MLEEIQRNFIINLRFLRKKKEYTQQEIADRLGINRTTYTKWETGVSEPGLKSIERLCNLLDVDYNTLFQRRILK
nr:MAG TPA: Repressor protein CI [Caudoviricetes sp.]